ncbi:MAG: hypothetical protein NT080_02200 [Spirochaetes bacterium]|nr:hypothetical protein [Spirochaetota bacterium]
MSLCRSATPAAWIPSTARATAAGLVDRVRKGFFAKDQTVLFWHAGGQPALFADRYGDGWQTQRSGLRRGDPD